MSSCKPCRENLFSQLLKGLKIDCASAKLNSGPHTGKLQDFLVNILILKYYSSFDQGLTMIPQGFLTIHQTPKVAKLGFCRKS